MGSNENSTHSTAAAVRPYSWTLKSQERGAGGTVQPYFLTVWLVHNLAPDRLHQSLGHRVPPGFVHLVLTHSPTQRLEQHGLTVHQPRDRQPCTPASNSPHSLVATMSRAMCMSRARAEHVPTRQQTSC